MMKRELYLDCAQNMIRAAVVEDGALCEIHSERNAGRKLTESVFYGRVSQIRPSVGAAFVDIGEELNAFLPLEDGQRLRCGDMIIVQGAAKQATETKGLRVSGRLNLAGKWLVLVPGESGVHISKKVKEPQLREELAAIAEKVCPEGCGLIVRTASSDVTREAMESEAQLLYLRWLGIQRKAAGMIRPGILYERAPLDLRIVRDMAGRELAAIVVNDEACYARLLEEQEAGRILPQTKITLYSERERLLFDVFGIEPQIDKALRKRVWLPCGGYLIIDPCEALTVIDVNSGKMTLGKDAEETALRVNLEAAKEAARQLRLREMGGIVVIDFIDMQDEAHREALIHAMKEAVKADRSPVTVEGITRLGLMEITRKRVHAPLHKTLCAGCTYCSGDGMLLGGGEIAQRALRQVRRLTLSGQRGPFVIRCAPGAANALMELKAPQGHTVYVAAQSGRHAERFEIEQIGEGKQPPRDAQPMEKE